MTYPLLANLVISMAGPVVIAGAIGVIMLLGKARHAYHFAHPGK